MSLLIMAPFNNNEKLSELVKLYPSLHNKQEKDFKKEGIKQRAWNEIARKLTMLTMLTMPEEGHDVYMPLFCFMKEYFFLVWP